MRRVALLAVAAALCAGCGSHRSVLEAGVSFRPDETPREVTSAQAVAAARSALSTWHRELATRAREDRRTRFPNLAPALLRTRVAEASRRYGFEVVRVRLNRPRQLAPEVVVRTRHYLELARAAPTILRALNPRLPASDDRQGWEYEGFYFEARDDHGVPFLLTFDFMRGRSPGGGQWARSDALFPFAHG
ncbi:MAG TPA: hypothetical protein VF101_02660 [Gaiellaceae bacterium]